MDAEQFIEKTFDYWSGYRSLLVDNDAPDGAWWQMIEDSFRDGMDGCLEVLEVEHPDADENDLAHAYLRMVAALEGDK